MVMKIKLATFLQMRVCVKKLRSCFALVFIHKLSFARTHCQNRFPSFGVLSSLGVCFNQ